MEEKILAVAKIVTGAPEEEWTYLESLCTAETEHLRSRMKEALCEQTQDAFICAAGWLAAANYYCGKGGNGVASWSAGEVSVKEKDAAAWNAVAENLRRAAEQLMKGKLCDEQFAFLGV